VRGALCPSPSPAVGLPHCRPMSREEAHSTKYGLMVGGAQGMGWQMKVMYKSACSKAAGRAVGGERRFANRKVLARRETRSRYGNKMFE